LACIQSINQEWPIKKRKHMKMCALSPLQIKGRLHRCILLTPSTAICSHSQNRSLHAHSS
jgi:hypothetical protein